MKAGKIIELLKDLPPDSDVVLDTVESEYYPGLTPLYPARQRKYFEGPKDNPNYNCWQDWEDCVHDTGFNGYKIQIELTSNIPSYYVLTDDS